MRGKPTAVASCVQQAVGAGAAGIVLDAIPYGMAYSALNAAVAKGVPVLVADQVPQPASTPSTDNVSYLPGAQDQASQIAWWITADSNGKANAIIAEEMKSGSVLKAVVVVDEAYEGWALTDQILRMATGIAPVQETIPTRLFTEQNIGTIQITTADQASGVWFGNTSFEDDFAKLWGVG